MRIRLLLLAVVFPLPLLACPGPAALTVPEHILTVTREGAGSGRVESVPAGIDCGAHCAAGFALGTQVTLAAEPEPGSLFEGFRQRGLLPHMCHDVGATALLLGAQRLRSARRRDDCRPDDARGGPGRR